MTERDAAMALHNIKDNIKVTILLIQHKDPKSMVTGLV